MRAKVSLQKEAIEALSTKSLKVLKLLNSLCSITEPSSEQTAVKMAPITIFPLPLFPKKLS